MSLYIFCSFNQELGRKKGALFQLLDNRKGLKRLFAFFYDDTFAENFHGVIYMWSISSTFYARIFHTKVFSLLRVWL